MAKVSLDQKARKANGNDRSCGKCNHYPCPDVMSKVCSEAFIKGYKKGYKQASVEYNKEKEFQKIQSFNQCIVYG